MHHASIGRDRPPLHRPLPVIWRIVEGIFSRRYAVRELDDDPASLLAYSVLRHGGAELALPSGAVIRPRDLILELHFRREALLAAASHGDGARVAVELMKRGRRDLTHLAERLQADEELREIRALHALTLFHRATQHFGFEVLPERTWLRERWFTWWEGTLMRRDRAKPVPPGGSGQALVVRHAWMTRERVLELFASEGAGR